MGIYSDRDWYFVLTSSDINKLAVKVSQAISEGYVPQGGIEYVKGHNNYLQAMVLKEKVI